MGYPRESDILDEITTMNRIAALLKTKQKYNLNQHELSINQMRESFHHSHPVSSKRPLPRREEVMHGMDSKNDYFRVFS